MNILSETLLDLRNSGKIVALETGYTCSGFYPIFDRLLDETGKYCQRYKTDIITEIMHLKECMKTDNDGLWFFGIRKNGVDGNSYIHLSIKQHEINRYEAIFAVEFHKHWHGLSEGNEYITIGLIECPLPTQNSYNPEDNNFKESDLNNYMLVTETWLLEKFPEIFGNLPDIDGIKPNKSRRKIFFTSPYNPDPGEIRP